MSENYVRNEYPLSNLTSRIIKVAKAVHQNLGPGYEEVFYQRALALELKAEGLDFAREVWINVHYRGVVIGKKRVDFVIEEVLAETKAKAELADQDYIQTISYLKASGYQVGMLLNFGAKQLGIKRFINEKSNRLER